MVSREINIWKSIDWITVVLYTILVFAGWVSIYAASYDFDNASIFDFNERSGKQLLWIGLSFGIGFILLMLEARMYEALAYFIYIVLMLLLVATIFLAPDIKGSRSWLVLGPERVEFVVGTGTGKFAAGGVCQVCNGSGVGETDKFL
ncbi:rod shape-determining protein RodA [Tannerella sp. CAG:118]|nr:rod shape-determining protein RodA [Tannerella sp. CAG:118]